MPLKYLAISDNIYYQCLARGGTKLMRVYYNVCVLMIEYTTTTMCVTSLLLKRLVRLTYNCEKDFFSV
jgi:hypothetical protein